MESTQQQLTKIIKGADTHSAIDGAIEQLTRYATAQKHEQKFISNCRALIMQRIVFVSFNNTIINN